MHTGEMQFSLMSLWTLISAAMDLEFRLSDFEISIMPVLSRIHSQVAIAATDSIQSIF